jgi:SPP1 family predicted phage head-tail adaptor
MTMDTFLNRLDERVTLQTAVRSADGGGGFSESWNTIATVWAAIAPATSSASTDAERQQTSRRYKVNVRYRNDLNVGMRLLWRSKALRVVGAGERSPRSLYRSLDCIDDGAIA